jgi:TonB family protein
MKGLLMVAAVACGGMSWAQAVEPPPISEVLKDSKPDPHALDFVQTGIHIPRPIVDPPPRIGQAGGIFRVGGGVTAPKVIQAPDPIYSEEARQKHVTGTVVLWVVVGADGLPHQIRVQKSVGYGLDEAAIEAVRRWKFKPSTKDGVPVNVQINVEVNFRL